MNKHFKFHTFKDLEAQSLSLAWILLACTALLLSGALAFVITAAKMPGLKEMVSSLDLIRWCLVIHVDLATLVWFTALPLALVHLSRSEDGEPGNGWGSALQWLGLTLSGLGVFLVVSALPNPRYEVILSNYIPVFTHPRFYMGLAFYILGVALNYLKLGMLWPKESGVVNRLLGLEESRFGLWIGTSFFLMAVAVFIWSMFLVKSQVSGPLKKEHFEVMMWGGGHLLQHSSASFLLVAWVLLASSALHRPLFSRRELFGIFALMGLPLFITPLLLRYSPFDTGFRDGFSMLMQWGIFPPFLLFLVKAFGRLGKQRIGECFGDYRWVALLLSSVLIVLGFLFGSLIRGSDMRIPGHYHASIGAVTLGFMAVSYLIFSNMVRGLRRSAVAITWSTWLFGVGQILFSSGMFVAGFFGMGRKTYGAEHSLEHWGHYVGFVGMAVGGIMAFAGGLAFAMAIWPYLRSGFRDFLNRNAAVASPTR